MKKDIENLGDIKNMVDTFYGRIQRDEYIGPIFNNQIQDRWPEHIAKMYTFWQTILLDDYTYQGRPFPPHAGLAIQQDHFDHWIQLFDKTVNDLFAGPIAEEAKGRGRKMAALFMMKLDNIRKSPFKPLM